MNKNLNKFKLGKDVLILSIMTLITVLSWVLFEVYRTVAKSTIPELTQKQMVSLDPKVNREIIQTLKNQLSLSEEELNTVVIVPKPESTEEPELVEETEEESL